MEWLYQLQQWLYLLVERFDPLSLSFILFNYCCYFFYSSLLPFMFVACIYRTMMEVQSEMLIYSTKYICMIYTHTFDYCYTCTTYTGMLTLSLVLTILFYIYINVAVCLWDFYFLLKNDCAFRISQDAFCGLRGIIKHGHQSVLTLWQSLLIYWCLTDSESLIVRLRSVKNCLILSTYHFSVRSFLIVT